MGKDKNNKKNVTFKNDTRSGTKSKPRRDNLRVLAERLNICKDTHKANKSKLNAASVANATRASALVVELRSFRSERSTSSLDKGSKFEGR
jgi:hypothetical protein